eukprot:7335012-Lingulodinium_polyedra.AAC.1
MCIRDSNRTMHDVVVLARAARAAGRPWAFENPHSSKMWQAPAMLRLAAQKGVFLAVTDYC